MGILDPLVRMLVERRSGSETGPNPYVSSASPVTYTAYGVADDPEIRHRSARALWKTQPHLRTVIDFIAKQVSQVGLHVFMRDGEWAERVRDGDVHSILSRPNEQQTGSEFIFSLVGTVALWEDALIVTVPSEVRSGRELWVFPTLDAGITKNQAGKITHYTVTLPETVDPIKVPAEDCCRFRGWTPGNASNGTSPVESLRNIFEEQYDSWAYRKQLWRKSGRFGGYLTRPADAPGWTDADRRRFDSMWNAFVGNHGSRAGDTPLLEDGIEFKRVGFAAKEDQWLESVKLSLETCAQVYHINPTMLGMLDNANYSNVREFRRALFGDSLGWMIKWIEDRLNTFLLPMLGARDGEFVEFNVEAKLRGSFEEQAAVLQDATGGPWQTRNEARRLMNLPPIEGGDDLIMPLNLTTSSGPGGAVADPGGDAESDTKPSAPNPFETEEEKSLLLGGGGDSDLGELKPILTRFADRQSKSVTSKKEAGDSNWWNSDRWNRELADDLVKSGVNGNVAREFASRFNQQAYKHYADKENAK